MSDTTLIGKPAAEPTPAVASRPLLCFERTPAGEHQLKSPALALSPEATRLLMLFEEPQTIDDLRRIIDETWLPSALIELERRRLLKRVDPARQLPPASAPSPLTARQTGTAAGPAPGNAAPANGQPDDIGRSPVIGRDLSTPDTPEAAATRLARQRAQARILFLQQIGRLSTLMIERIESCQSEAELQRLTPAFIDLLAAPPTAPARSLPVN
ncbi:MAG: hypothetical protein Q4B17_09585 [Lautropia sp.]|nr:hypothetical protein [Lautropia sp.]